ncbi:hypothetical protein GQ53DRAFT_740560 [Thozetella sp. PMI_491]|nr:hypothetical protein GQ53DRAFT_740560 [Thozetella sp. PMI_491]
MAPYNNNGVYQREPYYYGQQDPLVTDGGVDRIGDLARRLVPVMLGRSDRPLQVVMNFGHLEMDEKLHAQGSNRATSSRSATNAVVYNGPGCTMKIANPGRRRSLGETTDYVAPGYTMTVANSGRRRTRGEPSDYPPLVSGDMPIVDLGADRWIGICAHCSRRQLVAPTGYCIDCEASFRARDRGLLRYPSDSDRGWDGVRYLTGHEPRPWWRSAERARWERARNRERLLQGYYTDSDVSLRW